MDQQFESRPAQGRGVACSVSLHSDVRRPNHVVHRRVESGFPAQSARRSTGARASTPAARGYRRMTASSEIVGVIAGVALVLLAATVVARTLAFWPGPQESNATVANLNARLDAWWMMLALIALAFAFGRRGVIVLFAILSFAALREFMTLTRLGAEDRWALIVAFFVAVPLQYCLVWIGWYGLYAILIPVYAFVLMPILATLRGQPKAFLDRVAHAQWGVMLTVYCVSHVPALATLQIAGYEGREILLIAYFLLVVQSSDVFQYVWGKLF